MAVVCGCAMGLSELFLLTLLVLFTLPAEAMGPGEDVHCRDTLGNPSFFNKCRVENPPGVLAALGSTASQFVNPMLMAVGAVFLLVLLPLLVLDDRLPVQYGRQKQRFHMLRLQCIHFLHRMSYCQITNVALYCIFRQHRPCECGVDGVYVQIGSIYGMPSGDAMTGALVGATIIHHSPYNKIVSWVAATVVLVLKCIERLAQGYHSLGQVLAGSAMGIAFHLYSTHVPQWFMYVDTLVNITMGLLALKLDKHVKYDDNDAYNIMGWLWWGFGFQFYTIAMHLRHHYTTNNGKFDNMKESVTAMAERTQSRSSHARGSEILLSHEFEQPLEEKVNTTADAPFLLSATGAVFLLAWLSHLVQVYAWFVESP